jgi:signal transduction histidine kinase
MHTNGETSAGIAAAHPSQYRWSIRATALVAMATWWGLGLPYSLFTWHLDSKQLWWVLVCYGWEVPACGALGPFLFPMIWFRRIERRWDAVLVDDGGRDPVRVAALEATILDYPMRVAFVLLVTSLVGYGVGAIQLRWFAELPWVEFSKICVLGLVTGLVGALFAFLYLEWRLAPLVAHVGTKRAGGASTGVRVPLSQKIFASSLVLTLTALLLLGTIFYSRGERILEEEVGRRVLAEVRHLAAELTTGDARPTDPAWWRYREERMRLGPSGHAYLLDLGGTVVAGADERRSIWDEGFRPWVTSRVLGDPEPDHLVDRVFAPRIVAFTPDADGTRRVVAVAYRQEFAVELDRMLRRGSLVFAMGLLLALTQGFLLSRRLTRPIEVLTTMASDIARTPGGPWKTVAVRTNDEVGELAIAFNRMTGRLDDARLALERYSADLERRVAEATRNIATLYDVTRTTTSTLEIEDVLTLVAEKTLATLGLEQLVLLWHPPELDGVTDAFATSQSAVGERLELSEAVDLNALCPPAQRPAMVARAEVADALPPAVASRLDGEELLCLPLTYKSQLLGIIVAAAGETPPDLELAAALASPAAAALANAGLFETARRHELELRKLSQMRVQVQEESLRSLSRELHDGVGQVLTAIKIDLGMIERSQGDDAGALRAHVRDIREQVTELLQEVRSMSQLLRPSMLDDFGLVPTLQWFVEKFVARTQIDVDLTVPPSETRLPRPIEVLLYRVTQEALTNVVKHANARNVEIDLTVGDGHAVLTIADDGIGFDVERFRREPSTGGVGLLGMRERVAYYKGRIDIRSRPQAGVQIRLSIPIEGTEQAGPGERGRFPLAG